MNWRLRFKALRSSASRYSSLAISLAVLSLLLGCGRGRAPGAGEKPVSGVSAGGGPVWFVDVAVESGIDFVHDQGQSETLHMFETFTGGLAWIDYDQDGDPDLYFLSGQPLGPDGWYPRQGKNRLYRNDGGRFVDVTAQAGVAGHGYSLSVAVGDLDNDAYPDMFIVCFGETTLYRNRRDGTFEEVLDSGIRLPEPFNASATFLDYDGDGLLDIFVATYVHYDFQNPVRCTEVNPKTGERLRSYCGPVNYSGTPNFLFRNLGNWRFRDVSREAGIGTGADSQSKSLGSTALDLDEDGWVDIYVACDTTANLYYRNRGDGTFEEVGLERGVAASDAGTYDGSMGVAVGDANGDCLPDLFVTNFQEESNRVYIATKSGVFEDRTNQTGLGRGSGPNVGWGVAFFDAGCDGRLDLLVSNGHIYHNVDVWVPGRHYLQRFFFYLGRGDGTYEEIGATAGILAKEGPRRGAAFADYDRDGDVDVAVIQLNAPPLLLRAEGPKGHWLEVDLVGSGPGGRDAVGAKVEIEAGGQRQCRWRYGGGSYFSASEPRLHFGLGGAQRVDRLRVFWPGGGTTVLEGIECDRAIRVERGQESAQAH